ncbi:heme-containing dehydratase protein [Plectosphaerella cucumerina]|uniref:Heme-containing dehydratase protein n=1 Tax=Plectosphaerella cucumerina TaxID=40658 RepID=A0A8K0TA45_9PEZI|nr:heme-containing dehydratase protein [Plectosphaerella cucumerina]
MESAIAKHLQTERLIPVKTPAHYQPPFPAYTARFPAKLQGLVLAVIGIQHRDPSSVDGARLTLESFLSSQAPPFSQWAAVVDGQGFYNLTLLAYWESLAAYDEWASGSGFLAWWTSTKPEESGHGWFLEIFSPSMDRLETVFSDGQVPEGVAHLRESVSSPIKEHVYWGSMRDRMPAGQRDHLEGEAASLIPESSKSQRTRAKGKKNLAVIRSGQDWSDTLPEERKLYLANMHPILTKGMDFLRDDGEEVGCHACRFMDVVDPASREANKDQTFGLAFFDDLASLEKWSKSHPTHLAIFGGFLKYAAELNNEISLRLFHEVFVLRPEQQFFEYINCHVGTGMLGK